MSCRPLTAPLTMDRSSCSDGGTQRGPHQPGDSPLRRPGMLCGRGSARHGRRSHNRCSRRRSDPCSDATPLALLRSIAVAELQGPVDRATPDGTRAGHAGPVVVTAVAHRPSGALAPAARPWALPPCPATGASGRQAGERPLPSEVTLKLGQCPERMEDQPPPRVAVWMDSVSLSSSSIQSGESLVRRSRVASLAGTDAAARPRRTSKKRRTPSSGHSK